MRIPLYDLTAKRRTVGVMLNADLVARLAAHGINIASVAEAALVAAFEAAEKAKVEEEIKLAAAFTDAFVAEHGHPFPASAALFMPEAGDMPAAGGDAA